MTEQQNKNPSLQSEGFFYAYIWGMKRIGIILFVLISLFLITSCISIRPQTAQPVSNMRYGVSHYMVSIENSWDLKITTVDIDSCEYLIGIAGYDPRTMVMSHKGNCKYCAARKKGQ
ncbi:MAG: hypothetical protein ACYDCN_15700 [Bacteroidia bacterium]